MRTFVTELNQKERMFSIYVLTFSGNTRKQTIYKLLVKKSPFRSDGRKVAQMWWVTETKVYRKRLITFGTGGSYQEKFYLFIYNDLKIVCRFLILSI